jgi:hypothetical protein
MSDDRICKGCFCHGYERYNGEVMEVCNYHIYNKNSTLYTADNKANCSGYKESEGEGVYGFIGI